VKILKALWLIPFIVISGSLVVRAQCVANITGAGTTGTPAYIYVVKTLSMAQVCELTAFNNAFACFPGGQFPPVIGVTDNTSAVTASAFTTATMPYCRWNCGCGTVEINGPNDGLPVELMGFSID